VRSNAEILDGVSKDPGIVGAMARQMAELGATVTRVVTSDDKRHDEAMIVVIIGRKNIAGASKALDEWESRPTPARDGERDEKGGEGG